MTPKTFLVGITEPLHVGISDYLIYTKQEDCSWTGLKI